MALVCDSVTPPTPVSAGLPHNNLSSHSLTAQVESHRKAAAAAAAGKFKEEIVPVHTKVI